MTRTTTTTPPASRKARTVPADHDRGEAMRLALEAYQRFATLAASVTADQWGLPTDCTGWDVRALCGHLVGAMRFVASPVELVSQQREIRRRAARTGANETDAMTAVQVERTASLSTDELVDELAALAPKAARGRRRVPAPVRRWATLDVEGPGIHERWTMGYLLDVVLTRDAWLHKVDLARAVGAPLELDQAHDGQVVAGVAREWLERHGQQVDLHLEGAAGGHFGTPGPTELRMDAVEFCRVLSRRATGTGLLEVAVPF